MFKKYFTLLAAVFLLVGCSSANTAEVSDDELKETASEARRLSVIAPFGAPSMSLIKAVHEDIADIVTVDGPDALQAAFVNPSTEYDVIIAPTNLGMKLAKAGKSEYKLLGTVTNGNLYIVGTDEMQLDNEGIIGAFGEGAVAGQVFNKVFENDTIHEVVWYPSTSDAAAALLTGEVNLAMIAEPAATATVAKANEQGKELKIIGNLQDMYGDDGFPMAGVFVKEDNYYESLGSYQELLDAIIEVSSIYTENTDSFSEYIEEAGSEVFGPQSAAVMAKVFPRMNISFKPAKEQIETLSEFMKLFGVDEIEDTIIK